MGDGGRGGLRPGDGGDAGRALAPFEHRYGVARHPSSSGRAYRERRHAGHRDRLRDRWAGLTGGPRPKESASHP